jgi:pSer/pThr/pTyr-binding forkhead associated (FHA) protein
MQIPLPTVSRRHCEFLLEDDGVAVRDLGSANGTFINELRVQEKGLKPGDRLSVGPVIFTIVIDGKPGSINPVRTVIVETAAGSGAAAKSSVGSGTGIIAMNEGGSGELKMDDSMAAIEETAKKIKT